MPKFLIEREIPGAGKLSPAELKSISQKSCGVLSSMGPSVQWVHSYVTGDRIYCIYQAADEGLVKRHAELGPRELRTRQRRADGTIDVENTRSRIL